MGAYEDYGTRFERQAYAETVWLIYSKIVGSYNNYAL